ncbi:MAG TPA: hypothetical protein VHY08_07295 [Bacillota bacterium]|nr:hypothetical protein [Bacillota bacterium]
MWLKLTQFRAQLDTDEAQLPNLVAQLLTLPSQNISGFKILRKSLDARHHARTRVDAREASLFFVYTVAFEVNDLSTFSLHSLLERHPNLTEFTPPHPYLII